MTKTVEPGHIYELDWLDGVPTNGANLLTFVNRKCDNPHHACGERHAGTQSQEVLRALIDRAKHLDNCLHWDGNALVVHHLRMALALLESRALLRKVEKNLLKPEDVATGADGHFEWMRRFAS